MKTGADIVEIRHERYTREYGKNYLRGWKGVKERGESRLCKVEWRAR